MRTVARLAPPVLLAAMLDCASLPAIPAGTCGNGVVDANEDCDSFAVGGVACRAPNAAVGACRLDCAAGACPAGWGCGTDAICRRASGAFARGSNPIAAGAWRISAGDFDGDKRVDLLSREPIDPAGQSSVRLHFFDANAALAKTLLVPPTLAWPHVADVNGDQRADIVFTSFDVTSFGGVGTLLGQSDRTLVPVAYPTFTFPVSARGIALRDLVPGTTQFVFLVKDAKGATIVGTNPADGSAVALVATPDGPDALAGELSSGRAFEDTASLPCEAALLSYPKATEALVYPLCKRAGANVVLNAGGTFVRVALAGGATVDRGARFADVDGDGHLDVMIGVLDASSARKTHVAYGDGAGRFRSDPAGPFDGKASILRIPTQQLGETFEPELPLAVADVNGDRAPDFVLPTYVLSSFRASAGDAGADAGATQATYFVAAQRSRGQWTQAVIADFNANGALDVAAGSAGALDIDFYNGDGLGQFTHFTLPTNGTVSHFAAGDLDGDFLPDLAFAQSATGGDALAIAYGRPSGAPEAPAVVGRFERVVQTIAFNSGRPLDDLAVVSRPLDARALGSSFSVLAGTGDREPLALFSLTHPKVNTGLPFSALGGTFSKTSDVDIVAFAQDSAGQSYRLWLMKATPGLAPGQAPQFQQAIDGPKLSDKVQPIVSTPDKVDIVVVTASGDLDRDGVPEIVVYTPLGPNLDGAKSALTIAKSRPGDTQTPFDVADPITIDLPATQEAQLALADVDVDGALDVVLLAGADGGGSLVVYFNDGAGRFDPSRSMAVSANGEVVTGFASVGVGPNEPPAIAYVTATSIVLAHVDAQRRAVRPAPLGPTKGATGIVAGDVDGDGVEDLAIAEAGNLVIMRGQAVLP